MVLQRSAQTHKEGKRKERRSFLRKALPLLVQFANVLDGEVQPFDLGRDQELMAVPAGVKIALDYEVTDTVNALSCSEESKDAQ